MKKTYNRLKKWPPFSSLILVLVFTGINAFLIPRFFSMSYASSFLTTYTPLILLAMAETIVILTGGIDISIGAMISLVNATFITLLGLNWGFPQAMIVSVLAGTMIGVLNGIMVAYLRVTPMLVTLATSFIAGGIALWILPIPGGSAPMEFILWYQGNILGVFPSPLLFIFLIYGLWLIWKKTPYMIQLLALGNNMYKTYVSGVPVSYIKCFSYVFCGFIASVAGIAVTANAGAGDPTIGVSYTMNAIAACVIGGISLAGGKGEMVGAILGTIFLGLVFGTVFAAKIPPLMQTLVTGLIILLGILGSSYITLREGRKLPKNN